MKYTLFILYGISLFTIILGFIALLKQKTYIDKNTKEVTEIELPVVGKLKTNYPALVFLAMGVFIAVFVFNKTYNSKNTWQISGRFVDTTRTITDYSLGVLKIKPTDVITSNVYPDGRFYVEMNIESGYDLEDVIELIDYSYKDLSVNFEPKEEKKKRKNNAQSSCLLTSTTSIREYKPLVLKSFKY